MATEFVAIVPAGTRSLLGSVLEEDVEFQFDTPPLKVVRSVPYNDQRNVVLEQTIALLFNQRVDPSAIAQGVKLIGHPSLQLRLAAAAEVTGARD